MTGGAYQTDGWPRGLAPASWEVKLTDDGVPYPSASLWVPGWLSADGIDDLWWTSSMPIAYPPRRLDEDRTETLRRATRRAVAMARELEAERATAIIARVMGGCYGESLA